MSATLSIEKNNLIKNISECQGFEEYKMDVKSGSMKGDGYLGIINTIDIKDSKNRNKELHLIMKSAMDSEKLRESAPVRKAYDREIYMYQTVFPEFERLSEEHGITNKFTESAKCYGSLFTEKQECIILENLKEKGFQLWNRQLPMDEEHVGLVFATYAKFHATGLALKMLHPEKYEEFSKNLKNIFYKEEGNESGKESILETMKHIFENGFKAVANSEKATHAFKKFTNTCETFFLEDVKKVDKYCTILHGDCWCNNMMFRYNDSKNHSKPTEVCLIDWQISQIGSPILDLSYFFYTCSSKEVLYSLKQFLRIYHGSLTETLTEAGLNPKEILTYEELETQWKIYSKYGLFMVLIVMKVILSDSEEAPDLTELANSGKHVLETIAFAETVHIEALNKRITDIVEFMNEYGYI